MKDYKKFKAEYGDKPNEEEAKDLKEKKQKVEDTEIRDVVVRQNLYFKCNYNLVPDRIDKIVKRNMITS